MGNSCFKSNSEAEISLLIEKEEISDIYAEKNTFILQEKTTCRKKTIERHIQDLIKIVTLDSITEIIREMYEPSDMYEILAKKIGEQYINNGELDSDFINTYLKIYAYGGYTNNSVKYNINEAKQRLANLYELWQNYFNHLENSKYII